MPPDEVLVEVVIKKTWIEPQLVKDQWRYTQKASQERGRAVIDRNPLVSIQAMADFGISRIHPEDRRMVLSDGPYEPLALVSSASR